VKRCLLLLVAVTATWLPGCGPAGRNERPGPALAEAERVTASGFDTPYRVLDEALRSAQPPVQAMACETYLEADRRPPLSEVEALADARDPRVRTTALALLGTMGRRDLADLFRRKKRDAEAAVRLSADFGLAMTVEPERMTGLHDALSNPDVTLLRAAEAMHRLGSRAGLERVRVLTRHSRHRIRYYATRLLGRVGEKEDIPLLERLCQSRFLDVKFGAMAALARLGDFKRIGMLLDMVEAPDSQTRVLAARELGDASWPPGNSARRPTRPPSGPSRECCGARCPWNGRRRRPPLSGSAPPGSPGGRIFSRRGTPGSLSAAAPPTNRPAPRVKVYEA